jgi:hypothetical protein
MTLSQNKTQKKKEEKEGIHMSWLEMLAKEFC